MAEVLVAEKNEVILSVRHLSQHFGSLKAVDDVSFEVERGEVLGLVGESGCGKTTTGRSIIKLYNATDGDVLLGGKRIVAGTLTLRARKKAAIKKMTSVKDYFRVCREFNPLIRAAKRDQKKNKALEIQMIFQDPIASLDPRMTVRDIIAEGLVINGKQGKKDIRNAFFKKLISFKDTGGAFKEFFAAKKAAKQAIDEKVYEVLERMGLVREHATRYPHEFSGGQRQRIGIARAVVMQPKILIADEPVSALDVSIQAQVITLLNEVKDAFGLTVIFIAHDISVVKYFSDRIAVMYYGKIMELAPSDELFAHPLHPYTKSLLSAIPLPDPVYEKMRQRIAYNPLAAHDYSVNKPFMQEISKGHFIYCSESEFETFKKEIER